VIAELRAAQAAAAAGSPGRRLVLLRHGRTSWNEAGRAQGQADIELDDLGHAQAETVASHLAALRPAALWTSDLARARQTCSYLEKETGLSATHDERLRETSVGQRQGLTVAEFAEQFPAEHAAWVRGDENLRLPGAETTDEVAARMTTALRDCLAALEPGQTGVVVTHGAALRIGLVSLLGWPQEATDTVQALENCAWASLTELGYGGRLRLSSYNEAVPPGASRGPEQLVP
jgi:broad specificity phosphatase PhoE